MKATIKTEDGRIFTGKVEECKGFERIIGNLRISSRETTGEVVYPIRVSVLNNSDYGREQGKYGGTAIGIAGDILNEDDVKDVIIALKDVLYYCKENRDV